MWHAIEAVQKKEAQVAVSAGNTGALMAISMFQLAALDGIDRPAIAGLWPTVADKASCLMWAPTWNATRDQLVDFAIMGEAFARAVLGLNRPTVGLLNVGAEDMKGHDAVKMRGAILRESEICRWSSTVLSKETTSQTALWMWL